MHKCLRKYRESTLCPHAFTDPPGIADVKVSISPDGRVNPGIVKTGADGLVTVTVAPGGAEGVYVVEAVAGSDVARASVRVLPGD